VTRGRLSLAAALLVVVAAAAAVRLSRPEPQRPAAEVEPARLALLVISTERGPLAAVVGSGGSLPPAALVLPTGTALVIPGQGDATVGEAVTLDGPTAATAVANLLGVWVPHHAVLDGAELAGLIDRSGGIALGGRAFGGAEALRQAVEGGDGVFAAVLAAVLETVAWAPTDLPGSDSPTAVAEVLNGARGARVEVLPTEDLGAGVLRADPDVVRGALTRLWGFPDREVVPVVVLNGSGLPGVGELVAERLIPAGFRVVVSENAASFDHEVTAIVVADEGQRRLAERVRDSLGVGEVQVGGPASGLADVTVVVGRDLQA
jgi:hypothetical protein